MRRTHTGPHCKLAKRNLRYLGGTKGLRLRMRGDPVSQGLLNVTAYGDADFAAFASENGIHSYASPQDVSSRTLLMKNRTF